MAQLLCEKVDLDIEPEKVVYANAVETIKYLQDVVNSIEKRVLAGEVIDGFEVVEGKKTRIITELGMKILVETLGEETVYKTIKKPLGITELEKILTKEEIITLFNKGALAFQPGNPKVVLKE